MQYQYQNCGAYFSRTPRQGLRVSNKESQKPFCGLALVAAAGLFLLGSIVSHAEDRKPTAKAAPSAADAIANAFSTIGDQIYEECVFELSEEQIQVQLALTQAYVDKGADASVARRLAATQIQPPKLSEKCEKIRSSGDPTQTAWVTTLDEKKKPATGPVTKSAKKPAAKPSSKKPAAKKQKKSPPISLAGKKVLPRWDCEPSVDYVTVKIKGYDRKLSGGEICKPYKDVFHKVPPYLSSFRFGYTISTGRLFIISDNPSVSGKTVSWAISGRDVCRNNPDPDCLATRAVGSLPPGEYSFSSNKKKRITWGPITKRNVAAIYLRKLYNKSRFTSRQKAAILRRGNIAFHVRLKGEMSSACIGLEPKSWAYVASLIKEGRATGVNVYLNEPHPQIAEAPPLVEGSSFSLTSLFK